MLIKKIKYTDYDGLEREETFYFNLTQADIVKLENTKQMGFSNYLKQVAEIKDVPTLSDVFEELLKLTVGKKSEDGRKFIKNEAAYEDFRYSPAYDIVYMELLTNVDAAKNFFVQVLDPSVQPRVSAELAKIAQGENNA